MVILFQLDEVEAHIPMLLVLGFISVGFILLINHLHWLLILF
jgi:hypothetical protein